MKPRPLKLSNKQLLWFPFLFLEHRNAILNQINESEKAIKPIITDVAKEEIIRTIAVAMFNELDAHVTYWGGDTTHFITGRITCLERATKRLKIETGSHNQWIAFEEIINVKLH